MDNRITHTVFFDIAVGSASPRRVLIGLWGDNYPRSVDNFVGLSEKRYKGSKIFRVYPGVAVQGGDFVNNNGSGGYSIFGCRFDDEKPLIKPVPLFVAYANCGYRNDNGSQFVVFTGDADYLAGKYQVFGRVTAGMDVFKEIERSGADQRGNVLSEIVIVDSGVYY